MPVGKQVQSDGPRSLLEELPLNSRNLLIAGGIILSLVVAVFFLLPDDPGPRTGSGTSGAESQTGYGSGTSGKSEADAATNNSEGSSSFGNGSGGGDRTGSDQGLPGRRFRNEGRQNSSRDDGSFGNGREFEPGGSFDDRDM